MFHVHSDILELTRKFGGIPRDKMAAHRLTSDISLFTSDLVRHLGPVLHGVWLRRFRMGRCFRRAHYGVSPVRDWMFSYILDLLPQEKTANSHHRQPGACDVRRSVCRVDISSFPILALRILFSPLTCSKTRKLKKARAMGSQTEQIPI
jgi:hypothetical protein